MIWYRLNVWYVSFWIDIKININSGGFFIKKKKNDRRRGRSKWNNHRISAGIQRSCIGDVRYFGHSCGSWHWLKGGIRMKKTSIPFIMLMIFETIAITLWLTKDNIFYLCNFTYIGVSISLAIFLYIKQYRYACWTAMILDFLPYKIPEKPTKKIGWIRYITFCLSLIFVLVLLLRISETLKELCFGRL